MAFVTSLFVERKIRSFEITPFLKVQGEGLLLLGVIIFCNAIFPRTAQQLSLESVYYLLRDVFLCVWALHNIIFSGHLNKETHFYASVIV